ncbi:MAG: putative glycolipid-binding domain-containing protein [Chloroflexota bacterium]
MTNNQPAARERQVLWQPWSDPGMEHLHLLEDAEGVRADGLSILQEGDAVIRLRYRIRCTTSYEVREARVVLLEPEERSIILRAHADGTWTDGDGRPLPTLEGCVDIDINASPFTNTLPIRRLRLEPGQSAEILVAYITVPALEVYPAPQRYTCLSVESDHSVYRYEGLGTNFTADVRVDEDGLVVEYPELCRRLWSM